MALKRRFDPTSLAAKKLQAKQRQAHRIKLRKQLERARKNLGHDNNDGMMANIDSNHLEPAIDEAIQNTGKPAQATSPPISSGRMAKNRAERISNKGHHNKPDPLARAKAQRQARLEEKRLTIERREQEIREREVARAQKVKERAQLRQKLTERTRTGQPRLSRHIDVLLEKIQQQTKPSVNHQ